MCSSDSNRKRVTPRLVQINGRPVLQPKSNQVISPDKRNNSVKKITSPKSPTLKPSPMLKPFPILKPSPIPIVPNGSTTNTNNVTKTKHSKIMSPPISPKLKSPRPPAVKRGNNNSNNHHHPNDYELSSSTEKENSPRCRSKIRISSSPSVKKPKRNDSTNGAVQADRVAAVRREEVGVTKEERKMRIAHYGRIKKTKSASSSQHESKTIKQELSAVQPLVTSTSTSTALEEKRCSFITANSVMYRKSSTLIDPVYVAYHDEEWGVPVHDDKMLFELLVLTVAQVGSDWTSVLKKRHGFRDAFSGFDAEVVAKFTEQKMASIRAEYGLDLSLIRGIIDNAIRIQQVKKEMGSFDNYLWGFVNHKPINTQYKTCSKIPVKTSKSESISKDMVKRGFRFVGPIVVHSFMQAAGLTNDHLITCSRHIRCTANVANPDAAVAP